MNAPPDAQRVAHRWIAKADEDLEAAERLLAMDDSLASIQLVQMLPDSLASPIPLAELAPLNRYAVEARYPIGEEPLTGEEARSAIDIARRLRAFVLRAVVPDSSSG